MISSLRLAALFCLVLGNLYTTNARPSSSEAPSKAKTTQHLYADRLANLDLPLRADMDKQLSKKISAYMKHGVSGTELMLGRAEQYLPIFEQYLRRHDLPVSLKYLPIAESLLRSRAQSPAAAAGLWQLMPSTARAYGLKVNEVVDERLNIHLASDAAARILKTTYEEFGDWTLSLAAYNAGSGRVRKAIRLAGSREYIKLKRFLPRETQQYVSAYLAAAYAANYYNDHGLSPKRSRYTEQPLMYVKVYEEVSFRKLAKATSLSYSYLVKTNPAFKRGYIPQNSQGYQLCIPRSAHLLVHLMLEEQKDYVQIKKPQLLEAYQFASEQGFNPYQWLFGVQQTEFVFNNKHIGHLKPLADEMVLAFAQAQQALAIHP